MPHFSCHRIVCANGMCLKFHFYGTGFYFAFNGLPRSFSFGFFFFFWAWQQSKVVGLPTWNFNLFLHNFQGVCVCGKMFIKHPQECVSRLRRNVFVLNWDSRRMGAMVPWLRCPCPCWDTSGMPVWVTVTPIMHNFDGSHGTKEEG